ncbi:NUDIX domain-containing protein [Streptococcus moroccensis]|uniref:Isopentenyldiphosphate isomerase n=1 Tax=Streptococcus moroccensis TaxID=1451356 RepID=A0ABT9YP72_9STRE|nr:NUDIX domain-containing protein [Streptococcus moroccensis]MDQ0221783.1 isopentenyldiphosphate isomerase [Streptococcus moroccensis]
MEIWDIYDEQNQLTGETISRNAVHSLQKGQFHACVNALLIDEQGNILTQQRALTKEVNPGSWDLFTGGSLLTKETPEQGIAREVAEELGVTRLEFHYFGYEMRPDIKSIMHYFSAKIPQTSIKHLNLQESEVAQIAWVSFEEANALAKSNPFDWNWLQKMTSTKPLKL